MTLSNVHVSETHIATHHCTTHKFENRKWDLDTVKRTFISDKDMSLFTVNDMSIYQRIFSYQLLIRLCGLALCQWISYRSLTVILHTISPTSNLWWSTFCFSYMSWLFQKRYVVSVKWGKKVQEPTITRLWHARGTKHTLDSFIINLIDSLWNRPYVLMKYARILVTLKCTFSR